MGSGRSVEAESSRSDGPWEPTSTSATRAITGCAGRARVVRWGDPRGPVPFSVGDVPGNKDAASPATIAAGGGSTWLA